MSEGEGVELETEANTNPFKHSEFEQWPQSSPPHDLVSNAVDSMMGVNGLAIPTGSNAEESPVSSNTGKKRRKVHRKADDPLCNVERQLFYRKKRKGQFDPTHLDADLQKYSNLQNGFEFLEASIVVAASPDKSKTALLKDRAKDCSDKMSKDAIKEHIAQSDKELFHCFQGFFDSALGATQFASWTVGNIALLSSTGHSIYCPLPLWQSVVQIFMIVPIRDPF
eukprot:476985-Rhodomonas_salina.2